MIPILRRLRQGNYQEFDGSLCYREEKTLLQFLSSCEKGFSHNVSRILKSPLTHRLSAASQGAPLQEPREPIYILPAAL